MAKRVIVVPYDEQWKTEFETIKQHLLPVVKDIIIGIEHIGSTSVEEAEMYFKTNYCNQIGELKKRCVFVVDDKGNVVGSCIAWHDLKGNNTVASLHWLVVSPKYQGKHIGLVLCKKVMDIFNEHCETSVYIHTQPWSYKAILLYIKLGFKIQKTDTFSHYENQYKKAIKTLENILTEKQIFKLNQNIE